MDVTSLLNSSSAALQRRDSVESSTPSAIGGTTAASTAVHTPSPERTPSRRMSGSRSPNRNRTPWDAGGYSLPLSLDTKAVQTPSTGKALFYCESPADRHSSSSPRSPKHKLSDSRSSLSSYASSNNSVSHSRISSLSTVSEFQPLTNLLTEVTLNSRMSAEKPDNGAARHQGSPSPARSPPTSLRSNPAEERPAPTVYAQHNYSGPYPDDISPTQPVPPHRPGSPSDAVMIRRGQGITRSPSYLHEDTSNFTTSSLSPDHSLSRAHKRAVSAPDFPALDTVSTSASSEMPPRRAKAPALRADSDDSTDNAPQNAPRRIDVNDDIPGEPRCMFHKDGRVCEIHGHPGGNLRKAISHHFGRNKLCTRVIPEKVWVHICRKHYQRARYRNTEDFAKENQCRFLRNQVNRTQFWSDQNRREGKSPVMSSWKFSIRKREAERLTRPKRKREEEEDDDDFAYGVNEDDSALASGRAVPKWLMDQVGDGYSSAQILDIIAQIKQALDDKRLVAVPDVEFLPNMIGDDASTKGNTRRKPSTKAHTRSQSMVVQQPRRTEQRRSVGRRVSQPNTANYWDTEEDGYSTPAIKRQRVESENHNEERHVLPSLPPRSMERIVPTMRPFQPRGYGDSYNTGNYQRTPPTTTPYNYGVLATTNGPLPAPTPSTNPETPRGNTYGRPAHQRSYSEAGTSAHGAQSSYRPSYSSTSGADYYFTANQGHPQSEAVFNNYTPQTRTNSYGAIDSGSPGYHDSTFRQQTSWNTTPQSLYSYQSTRGSSASFGGGAKHTRHLSTPMAPRTFSSEASFFQTPAQLERPAYSTPASNYQVGYTPSSYAPSSILPSISRGEAVDDGQPSQDDLTGLMIRR